MESTRDESQDPLLDEQMIVSQTPIELETNTYMIDQEQETEIIITAIIEEINRSISSKNSSMHEDTRSQE